MISGRGSLRNAMISGVISSSSSPRVSTRSSRERMMPSALSKSGSQRLAVEGVVAHAEEGEIVGQQPLQELDRLGDLVHRQRRRIGLELGDDAVDAAEHRPPVLHASRTSPSTPVERRDDLGARGRVVDRLDMDMDEAFARAAGGIGRAERDQLAARRARRRTPDAPPAARRAGARPIRPSPNRPGTACRR